MTLRTRILLTVAPLLLLTAALGAADALLLVHMGRSIDYIFATTSAAWTTWSI